MLFHHDTRAYDVAANEAADWARTKLQRLIDDGRPKAAKVIEAVQRAQPVDHVVRSTALEFTPHATGKGVDVAFANVKQSLHDNALRQAAAKAGLPWTYARKLLDDEHAGWGAELLAANLRKLYAEQFGASKARFLLRSSDGEVRGFLSDRFRRLDSRPIVDSFARACSSVGAVPMDGFVTATKMGLRALLPALFEPVPNEIVAFGVSLENSDFGNGALSLRVYCLRLWCSNCAIADEGIRAVHLGARLGEDFAWSNRTHGLDTKRMASAISDVVGSQLAKSRIDAFQDVIRQADQEKIAPAQVGSFLRKTLAKADVERVCDAFRSADVENLPAGNTRWRLSNAISWVAGQADEPEAKLELMKLAGKALPAISKEA